MTPYFNEWIKQYKGFNDNIKLALLGSLLTQGGLGLFMTIYNFYIRELGHSDLLNGKVIAMTAIAQTIFLVPAGVASNLIGKKKIILLGILFTGLSLIGRAFFITDHFLLFLAFCSGMFISFIQVSFIPYLAQNSNEKQRVHLYSFHFAVMMAAAILGNISAGLLSDLFTSQFGLDELRSVRITLLIGAIIFLLGLMPTFLLKEMNEKKYPLPFHISTLKKNSSIWKLIGMFTGAALIIGLGSGLVIPYLNLYFEDRFEVSHSQIGFILSLGQASTMLAMLIGPAFVSRLGEVKAVVTLQLCSLPFLLITGFTSHLYVAVFAFLIRQALMNAGNPIQTSLIMKKIPDDLKGIANSLNQMAFNFGWATMGPVSTSIVLVFGSYWGYAYVFMITSVIYLIGSTYFYFMFREKRENVMNDVARQLT